MPCVNFRRGVQIFQKKNSHSLIYKELLCIPLLKLIGTILKGREERLHFRKNVHLECTLFERSQAALMVYK